MKALCFVLAVVFLAGCLNSADETATQTQEIHYVSSNPLLRPCNNRTTVDDRETCYSDTAYADTDTRICGEIGSARIRNLCYDKLAKKLDNPGICSNIGGDDWRYTDCIGGSSK